MKNFSATEAQAITNATVRSILAKGQGKDIDPLNREVDRDIRRNLPANLKAPPEGNSFAVPLAALVRSLTTNTFAAGGAFVDGQQGEVDEILRPFSAVVNAGAQVITGLRGNLSIPREITRTTCEWLSEGETLTETDGSFGALNLTPHRISGATSISPQLETQSDGLVSRFLLRSLVSGIGAAVDSAAINGSGVAGEPLGIYNTANVQTVTFGGAASLAKACEIEDTIADKDADDSKVSFIAHPGVRQKWRTIQRWTGASLPLWTDDGRVIGRPASVTSHAPSGGIVCGDFSKAVLAFWGEDVPVFLTINPFTQSLAGKISFVASAFADVGLLRPDLFVKNADSATQ